jgi:guanylate kinase
MTRQSAAFPVVISGPSGVGKTTLEDRVVAADTLLVASISSTTREPRDNEKHGEDYFFVSREQFELSKKIDMVEWAEVHGEYYGTPRPFMEAELAAGRDVMLNIDVQGGIRLKKTFPRAVMIFILPPSFDSLKERILKRGADFTIDIGVRMENAIKEIAASDKYDYLVVNDKLERAVAQIQSIIDAERCRKDRCNGGFIANLIKPAHQ